MLVTDNVEVKLTSVEENSFSTLVVAGQEWAHQAHHRQRHPVPGARDNRH